MDKAVGCHVRIREEYLDEGHIRYRWVEYTRYFKGHFDGNGHTITVENLTSLDNCGDDGNKYMAPFRRIDNATIQDLHVTGTINVSDKYAGGLVGYANGDDNEITRCWSSVIIISSLYYQDGSYGGLIGYIDGNDKVIVRDCLVDGGLRDKSYSYYTKNCGGFVGWCKGRVEFYNCLGNIKQNNFTISAEGYKVMSRKGGTVKIYNCYSGQTYLYYVYDHSWAQDGCEMVYLNNEGVPTQVATQLGPHWRAIEEEDAVIPILNSMTPPTGEGTQAVPYLIASNDNWEFVAYQVKEGVNYSGKYFRLTEDIEVITMIGTSDSRFFSGTFDGNGHTITFTQTINSEYCAPFRYIKNATIKNLQVTGSITTSDKYAGGLVGRSDGDNTIERCIVNVSINSSVNGDGSHGGFIGQVETGTVKINYCLFDGRLLGSNTTKCGGFIGWVDDDTDATLNRCLFNPAETSLSSDCKTFARAEQSGDLHLNTCYYKQVLGDAQGNSAGTLTTDELVTALGIDYWQNIADAALPVMDFYVVDFEGEGTEGNPYLIASEDNWNCLARNVNNGTAYEGYFFKMTADISTNKMVGNSYTKVFKGTFDGNGHTLNINLTGSGEYVAPFAALDHASIKNLNITGNITTSGMRPASVASYVIYAFITNCSSSVNIVSSYNSDIDAGAFVARVNQNGYVKIEGCIFTGSITYSNSNGYEGGGFVGWTQSGAYALVENGIFAPTAINITKFTDYNMFVGGIGLDPGLSTCYYNDVAAATSFVRQGCQMHSITAGDYTSVACYYPGDEYNVSGITHYNEGNGLKYNDVLYAGYDEASNTGEEIRLVLGYQPSVDYTFDGGYTTSKGTLTNNTTYYTLTMANDDCIISADITLNTFHTQGEWNVSDSWSTGVLPYNCDVIVSKPAYIPNGYTASVGNISFSGTGSITISDRGQLVAENAVSAKLMKSISASTTNPVENKWYLIASPVNNQAFSQVTGLQLGTHNIYRYDEPTNMWQEYRNESNPFSSFENGRGYLFRTTYTGGSIVFDGTLNASTVEYELSYTEAAGALSGFNIVGNPFPHDIYKGIAISNDYLEENYCVLNTNGTWTITNDDVAIAPGQGILVQAKPGAGSLDIHNTNEAPEPSSRADNDNIWFTVKNSEFMDKACVEFRDGHGFNKPTHYNADAPMFYVRYDDEDFASVCMPDETEVINLRFESKNMSQYTLTVNANGNFSYLHLIDKVANKDIDMLIDDSYTFVGSSTDDKDRFEVVLRYNADPASTPTETFAYQSGNDIIVNGEGELQVFDVMGRMISTRRVTGVETIEKPSQTGIYIFKLNEKTQKIVVR